MQPQKSSNNNRSFVFTLFFIINFIEGGIVFFNFFKSPSMEKNVFALGYSLERLVTGAFLLIPVIAFLYLSTRSCFDKRLRDILSTNIDRFASKDNILLSFFIISFSLLIIDFMIILFFPFLPLFQSSNIAFVVYERINPFLIWFIIFILQTYSLLVFLIPSVYPKISQEINLRLYPLSKRRFFHLAIIVVCFFPLALLYAKHIYSTCDDTYISLVYVKNFLQGNGLTYNGMRVEGFTSTLWVMILISFGAFGFSLPPLAETLSLISGLLALLSTYHLSKVIGMGKNWALLPLVLLIATGDFTFYMSVGLEQVLFTAFLALCVAESLSGKTETVLRSKRFVILNALMILTRPEGALIFVLLLLYLLGKSKSIMLAIRPVVTLMFLLLPITIVKRVYYGYWLPNTYYAKSNAGIQNLPQGLEYFQETFPRYSFVLIIILIIFCLLLINRNYHKLKSAFLITMIILVWGLYVVFQGGDNMVGGRLFVPILPLLYVLLVNLLKGVIRYKFAFLVTLLVSVVLFVGYIQDEGVTNHFLAWRESTDIQMRAGLYLKENYPPDTLVALNASGIIPYYSEMTTIDMLGLNNEYIAHYGKFDRNLPFGHQRGDGNYVLSLSPDIILFRGRLQPSPSIFISDREIWNSEVFQNSYQMVEFPNIGYGFIKNNKP